MANGGRDKYCLRINSTRILLLHPTLHHDLGDLTTGMQLTVRGEHLDSTRRLHTSHGSMTRSTDSNSVHTSIHTVESSAMDVHEVVVHHHLSPEEVSGDEHEATTSAVARRSLASTPQPLKATGSVSAIVVRVSQCGGSIQPSFTISDIYGAFFPGFQPKNLFSGQSNLNPLQSYTYQDAYSKCSYGQSSISQAKINIVPQTIDICSPSGQPFEICSDDMLPSIGTLVNSHLQSAGYDTTKYDRVIMFLPAPSTCPILGWGTVGCTKGTPCSVWGMAADVTLLMHESSHNFGLNHAQGYGSYDPSTGSWVNEEYGDVSCRYELALI